VAGFDDPDVTRPPVDMSITGLLPWRSDATDMGQSPAQLLD
jgi:hypothetical protein